MKLLSTVALACALVAPAGAFSPGLTLYAQNKPTDIPGWSMGLDVVFQSPSMGLHHDFIVDEEITMYTATTMDGPGAGSYAGSVTIPDTAGGGLLISAGASEQEYSGAQIQLSELGAGGFIANKTFAMTVTFQKADADSGDFVIGWASVDGASASLLALSTAHAVQITSGYGLYLRGLDNAATVDLVSMSNGTETVQVNDFVTLANATDVTIGIVARPHSGTQWVVDLYVNGIFSTRTAPITLGLFATAPQVPAISFVAGAAAAETMTVKTWRWARER